MINEVNKSLSQLAYNKMCREFNNYCDKLAECAPKFIIDRSFETSEKKSILDTFSPEQVNFTNEQLQVIIQKSEPLETLYQNWLGFDGDGYEDLLYCLHEKLDEEYEKLTKHDESVRLFVDMDGTLAEFKKAAQIEDLFEQGYFANLKPLDNVLAAVRELNQNPNYQVYILSSVLTDSQYAELEKKEWLKQHFSELKNEQIIFSECGKSKVNYIPGGIKNTDILLDDYTVNLNEWKQAGGKPLKVLNGINNHTHVWSFNFVHYESDPTSIANSVNSSANENTSPTQAPILPNSLYSPSNMILE